MRKPSLPFRWLHSLRTSSMRNNEHRTTRRIRLEALEPRHLLATAVSDNYFMHPNTTLSIPGPGVLSNDLGTGLQAILDHGPNVEDPNFTFSLGFGGGFTYRPIANFTGGDNFSYHDFDGVSSSNVAAVVISIGNVAPTANSANYDGNAPQFPLAEKNHSFTFDLVSNATDPEGDHLTVSKINENAYIPQSTVRLQHGNLQENPDETFTYTPDAGFYGSDGFGYRVTDNYVGGALESNQAFIGIKVAPIAIAGGSQTIPEGGSFDLDGDAIGNIQSYEWYVDNIVGAHEPAVGQAVLTGQTQHVTWPMLNQLGITKNTDPSNPAEITLRVVDALGQISYDQATLIVEEVDPQVPIDPITETSAMVISPVLSACGGNVVQLQATFTDANPFDTNFTVGIDWNWDIFGTEPDAPVADESLSYVDNHDGTFTVKAIVGDGPITHDYGAAGGLFLPTLIITEEDGNSGFGNTSDFFLSLPPSTVENTGTTQTQTTDTVEGAPILITVPTGVSGALAAPASSEHGTVEILDATTLRYTPSASMDGEGDDHFSYTVGGACGTTVNVTVHVHNAPPTATFGDNNPVNEASAVSVFFSTPSDPSISDTQAGFHYSFALSQAALANTYVDATDGATRLYTFDDNGTYTVYGRIFDKDGGYSDYSTDVDVNNVVPTTAIVVAPFSGAEGTTISFDNSTTDPSNADTAAGFAYAWSVTKNGSPYSTGSASTFSFTPDDNGTYVVSLKATDKNGGVGTATPVTINVTNLDPAATPVSGPVQAVTQQPLNFSTSVSDPGTADILTTGWQVLNSSNTIIASGNGTSFSFTPSVTGNYTVKFNVADDDGGTASVSQSLTVSAVLMQGNTLLVGGTSGDDTLDIKPGASAGQFKVLINGVSQGSTFAPTSMQVFGGAGTDTLTVEGDGTANTFEVRTDRIVFNGVGMFDNGIESRAINAHGSTDQITVYGGSASVNGGAGSDSLIAAAGVNVWTLTSPTAGTLNGVSFSSIEQLVGAGSDTLVGPDTSNVWKITGIRSGTLGGSAFSGFATVQGGSGTDTFRITEGVASGLTLNGGGGADKLDYGGYVGGINVNLSTGLATGAAHIAGIENVQGGDGADIIHGDANDNILAGGAGTDILVGGAGNDTLSGGAASDLLIGGTGADLLAGNADEDILIGGTTTYDANDTALMALLNAWAGAGTYAARVTSVSTGVGVAGGYYLLGDHGTGQTVFTDNDLDTLTGSGGRDFFFANKTADNGGPIDNVTDEAANEFWDDTDF